MVMQLLQLPATWRIDCISRCQPSHLNSINICWTLSTLTYHAVAIWTHYIREQTKHFDKAPKHLHAMRSVEGNGCSLAERVASHVSQAGVAAVF